MADKAIDTIISNICDRPAICNPAALDDECAEHKQALLAAIDEGAPTLRHIVSKEYNDGYADACMAWKEHIHALFGKEVK